MSKLADGFAYLGTPKLMTARSCLFCQVFSGNCTKCMPQSLEDDSPCVDIPYKERIDKGIDKLYKVGVFTEI